MRHDRSCSCIRCTYHVGAGAARRVLAVIGGAAHNFAHAKAAAAAFEVHGLPRNAANRCGHALYYRYNGTDMLPIGMYHRGFRRTIYGPIGTLP